MKTRSPLSSLQAGFWPGTVDSHGRTSLHYAAMSGLPPACEAVPAGPARMGLQQPPAAAPVPAAMPDHHHAAELLLSAGGLNWHAVDKHGCSALHYAAGMSYSFLPNNFNLPFNPPLPLTTPPFPTSPFHSPPAGSPRAGSHA